MSLYDLSVPELEVQVAADMDALVLRDYAFKLSCSLNNANVLVQQLFGKVPTKGNAEKICADALHIHEWIVNGKIIKPEMVSSGETSASVEMKLSPEQIDIITGHAPDGGNPPQWNDAPPKATLKDLGEHLDKPYTPAPFVGVYNAKTGKSFTDVELAEMPRASFDLIGGSRAVPVDLGVDPYEPTDLTEPPRMSDASEH